MFKKILYPTDFSDYAYGIFQCIAELKTLGVEVVVYVHVIDLKTVRGAVTLLQKNAKSLMEKREIVMEEHGVSVTPRILVGDPAKEIINVAEKEDVSLILLGARGKGLIREAFLGSISYNVVRSATKPVLVMKFKTVQRAGKMCCELVCRPMFRKILYPTDFSECSERTLKYVNEAIDSGTGVEEVVIIHVVDKGEIPEELEENKRKAKTVLEDLKGAIQKKDVKIKTLITTGIASEEILRVAQEENVSIIMIGSRGLGFIKGMLLGSTSDRVIRRAEIPVFLCRRKLKE